jgi:hypothetical protein
MGIPSPYIWGSPILPNVFLSNPVDTPYLVTMGDTVLTEALVNLDSNKRIVMGGVNNRKKQGSYFGPWLIGIIIGLGGIIALAWRKFKSKIKA